MFLTMGASRKLPATALTFMCLLISLGTAFCDNPIERWTMFATGSVVFVVTIFQVFRAVTKYKVNHSTAGTGDLNRALVTMLAVWSCFPVVWVLCT